jgi:glutamate/tyrosine decarboxylase-like PLP-dependent enzyme
MKFVANAETTASDLEPTLRAAAEHAISYACGVRSRRVVPTTAAIDGLREFMRALPESPTAPLDIIEQLDRCGSPATVATTGGRYFGFVNGGAVPASMAASWIAAVWDQNAALRVMSPVAAALEDVALSWVRDILGLPAQCGGAIVTGATVANMAALGAARHALLDRRGWNVEREGLFGAPTLKVVVGDEVHVSLLKALSLLGLGSHRVHRVPVDGQGRMRSDALPSLDEDTIVCIQAGNVNTGAFDPAGEICRAAHTAGAWVHVDGAFGLWAAVSPRFRHLTDGVAEADSWATDGHKWPNVGYDCGIALVRNPRDLYSAMRATSAYFTPGAEREPSQFAPEMSRRARGVELWATLCSLGRSGLVELIERTCTHAQHFARGLRDRGFEILNEVAINQVLVSFGSSETTRAVIERLQSGGTCWCGGTEWQGRLAMRISVSSWATADNDVETSLAAIAAAADECGAVAQPPRRASNHADDC